MLLWKTCYANLMDDIKTVFEHTQYFHVEEETFVDDATQFIDRLKKLTQDSNLLLPSKKRMQNLSKYYFDKIGQFVPGKMEQESKVDELLQDANHLYFDLLGNLKI